MGQNKTFEKAITKTAAVAWSVFQSVNQRFQGKLFQPKWAAEPLLKQKEKSFPTLGKIITDQIGAGDAAEADRGIDESYRTKLY